MCPPANKSSTEANGDVFFNLRMKPEMHEQLAALAKRNERTLAAEVRLAIRVAIAEEKAAGK